MSRKKCYKCGLVDSLHMKDEGRSKLVWAFGPKDDDGLQMYFIYCRVCGHVNIYKPGWFGNIRFDSYMNVREVYGLYQGGRIKREEMGIFAGKLQDAMIEDGLLPNDWSENSTSVIRNEEGSKKTGIEKLHGDVGAPGATIARWQRDAERGNADAQYNLASPEISQLRKQKGRSGC